MPAADINPGGRTTKKTVVQKNRVKALDGDWNALKQKTGALRPLRYSST